MPNELFKRIDSLGVFSTHGELISTPAEIIDAIKKRYSEHVQEMIGTEGTEFSEGFLSGIFFCKGMEVGHKLAVLNGDFSEEVAKEILEAQIDTVVTLLAEALAERRSAN